MKQTAKAATGNTPHTNIRLDPLNKAKLAWCKAFYESKNEPVSASMVFRRAIELLTDHLGQLNGSDMNDRSRLELELFRVLSCTNNKSDPFNNKYPWNSQEEKGNLNPFHRYLPNTSIDILKIPTDRPVES